MVDKKQTYTVAIKVTNAQGKTVEFPLPYMKTTENYYHNGIQTERGKSNDDAPFFGRVWIRKDIVDGKPDKGRTAATAATAAPELNDAYFDKLAEAIARREAKNASK